MEHSHWWAARLGPVLLLVVLFIHPSYAGGGPENVVVVVNADSWASMTIANEFIHLRRIPPANVIYLDNLPDIERIDVEAFRERILKPVFKSVQSRGIAGQMDYLVYSSDIPYRINVSRDTQGKKPPRVMTPHGSVNGLTYLYGFVLSGTPSYLSLSVNRYARRPLPQLEAQPIPKDRQETFAGAMELAEEEKWPEAADLFRELLKDTPRSPELLYNLGRCLARMKQGDEALRVLERLPEAGHLDISGLLENDDFNSIRKRDDFKALLERMTARRLDVQPTRAFRAVYSWNAEGEVVRKGGPRYLLSTMLGMTSGRGNSVSEVVECLQRSVAADGTRPQGTVYYLHNHNIRSRVRQWGFEAAAAKLRELGVDTEVIRGDLPQDKPDVQGLMVGAATFDWTKSKSKILPGAICEHLTSTGGCLSEGDKQTPLTEFIRHGAAGASGTVTEPFAIQDKFPDPFIHVHYARGCSLAESFYQSVRGPYQLLIVGDPLCRPWAHIPEVTVEGVKPGATVKGMVSLRPGIASVSAGFVSHYELFVDGKRRTGVRPSESFDLDTRDLSDGYHELRIVAVIADRIETQGELLLPLQVRNSRRRLEITPPPESDIPWGETIELSAQLRGAATISFFHNQRQLATAKGDEREVALDSRKLGLGPIELRAVGIVGEGEEVIRVTSAPLALRIVPPAALPPLDLKPSVKWTKGLLLTPEGGAPVAIESTRKADWPAKAGIEAQQRFSLVGYFDVSQEDVYQFQVRSDGKLELEVDSLALGETTIGKWTLLPVSLAPGAHRLTVHGAMGAKRQLRLRFGGPGALSVGADRFRHTTTGAPERAAQGRLTGRARASSPHPPSAPQTSPHRFVRWLREAPVSHGFAVAGTLVLIVALLAGILVHRSRRPGRSLPTVLVLS